MSQQLVVLDRPADPAAACCPPIAGLIEGDRRGTWVYYRPVPANLQQLASLLDVPSTVTGA